MIPLIISVLLILQAGQTGDAMINVVGTTMLLKFAVISGYTLPVNAEQDTIAHRTGTFDMRVFAHTRLVITLAAFVLLVVFSPTYWLWRCT